MELSWQGTCMKFWIQPTAPYEAEHKTTRVQGGSGWQDSSWAKAQAIRPDNPGPIPKNQLSVCPLTHTCTFWPEYTQNYTYTMNKFVFFFKVHHHPQLLREFESNLDYM